MATKNTTFKFNDTDLKNLDELATDLRCSRTQAIRIAVAELRKVRGLHREALESYIASLNERFGEHATLSIEIDEQFDAIARIDGEHRADIDLPTHVSTWEDASGRAVEYIMAYLAVPGSDARLAVAGLFPLKAGLSVSLPLGELAPDMQPRPVSFWVDG